MIGTHPSEVVRVVCTVLSPFVVMFGLYVIAHGHYGPGGGFAGGVFAAVGVILSRLTLPRRLAFSIIRPSFGPRAAALGLLLYLACGLAPLAYGGAFLDYGAVELAGMAPARVRYLAILIVEIGVGLAVFGSMLLLFDVLTGATSSSDRDRAGRT